MLRIILILSFFIPISCKTSGVEESKSASVKTGSSKISPSSAEPVRAPNNGYVYKKYQVEGKIAELLYDEMLIRYSDIKLYRKSFTKNKNVTTVVFMENGPHYLRCDDDSNNKFECTYYRPAMYYTRPFTGEFSEILSNAILISQGKKVIPYVPYDPTQVELDRTSEPFGETVSTDDLFSGDLTCKCVYILAGDSGPLGTADFRHKEFECRFR